jgi:hypothetical protein
MSSFDQRLERLLHAAALAPREMPAGMPPGFATRVLAHAAPAAFDTSGAVFRFALALGCALMMVSVAVSHHLLTAPVSVEVAIANSAIGVNLP